MWKLKSIMYKQSKSVTDGNGLLKRERVVDPYSSQPFMVNQYGWIASDISLLMSSESQQIQDNLMAKLQVLKSTSSNMSPREMLDSLVPRYCQSYAERAQFMDYVHEKYPEFFGEKQDEDVADIVNDQ